MHLISLGAGVQSSTMALMAACGELGPMPDGAIFADTQAEPASVYHWLDWLESRLPFPVHRVTRGSLEESALALHVSKKGGRYYKTAIPFHTLDRDNKKGRVSHRTCTRDYKILPILRFFRNEVGAKAMTDWRRKHRDHLTEWRAYQKREKDRRKAEKAGQQQPPSLPFPRAAWDAMQADALVTQWIGISLDEIQRAKPSRDPWIYCRWPLIERRMPRLACLGWMRSHGYPEPPRSACWFCPFRSNREWRYLRDNDPEDFAKAVEFDQTGRAIRGGTNWKSMPFIHKSCVPLEDADLRSDEERGQLLLWQDECTGMCGV